MNPFFVCRWPTRVRLGSVRFSTAHSNSRGHRRHFILFFSWRLANNNKKFLCVGLHVRIQKIRSSMHIILMEPVWCYLSLFFFFLPKMWNGWKTRREMKEWGCVCVCVCVFYIKNNNTQTLTLCAGKLVMLLRHKREPPPVSFFYQKENKIRGQREKEIFWTTTTLLKKNVEREKYV